MNFERNWSAFAIEAEIEDHGAVRIVRAHNEQIARLQNRIKELETELNRKVAEESKND